MRKRIKITAKGAEALDDWLRSSSGESGENRARYDFFKALPFLTKFSFFYELDDATVSKKLEKQRKLHRAKLNDFISARKKMVDKGLQPCKIQTIDFGIMLEETILQWLDTTIDQYTGTGKKSKAKQAARSG